MTRPARLCYLVDGLDCPSCAHKVKTATRHLPGVQGVTLDLTAHTLELVLDETQTPRKTLETHLRTLGHALTPRDPKTQSHPQPWYSTRQGRRVVFCGGLLVLAFGLARLAPALAPAAFALATLVTVWPLARQAWAATRAGNPFGINTLVSLAALGALLIGEAAEGAVVVFLFAVGELLEGVAAGRAQRSVAALVALTPKTARLLTDEGVREVAASSLRVGQRVQVRPGDRVPTDGVILEGESSLDDSPVTGESSPVVKTPGARVYAGSINHDGALIVQVDKAAADTTLARILGLVQEAQSSKAPTARLIDRFSRRYTPLVVLVAALTALVPPLFTGVWHPWLYRGITLLLIGCPCALVLSVPAAIASGVAAGARQGLLVKGGAVLEALSRIRTVAFDKTGTLTTGRPRVTDIIPFNVPLAVSEAFLLQRAASVEAASAHPIAKAVLARAQGLALLETQDARAHPGQAVSAVIGGRTVTVGSVRFVAARYPLADDVQRQVAALEQDGKTVVVVVDDDRPIGLLALRDEPRTDARETLTALHRLGVESVMLTGDNARTATALADSLGLAAQAELLPEDKLRVIRELRNRGGVAGGVAMVGDGINDAPALAQADVGIALAGGTDVALETAHASLLGGHLAGVETLLQLARAVMRTIHQNIAVALGLKALFVVATLFGVTTLWMAVMADTGATLLVTANALRLLAFRAHPVKRTPLSIDPL